MINDIRHFTKELNLIADPRFREFTRDFLQTQTPAYFWTDGASSSGKFHPKFSQGEGGLVRHVKAAVMFCDELLRLSQYSYMSQTFQDFAVMAVLMHDCRKYGPNDKPDREFYPNHGRWAAEAVAAFWEAQFPDDCPDLLFMAIASHMGQWHGDAEPRPFTPVDRLVHMADYMSSRNFIDIPEIVEDWNIIAAIPEGA